jgi:SAM-dependent methyltransferase
MCSRYAEGETGMNLDEYEVMYLAEDRHWWYAGMETITRAILDRVVGRGRGLRILDAGCGTGAVMGYLSDYGTATGFDFSAEALKFCRKRDRSRLVRASVMAPPFRDSSFDLVVSFDVLCERAVPDDGLALREFARVLAPGGRVLLRLPAYGWLRGRHDEAVHIRHRYTTGELRERFDAAGFEAEHLSYANTFLFPVAAAKRFAERVLPTQSQSDLTIGTGIFNGPLRRILAAEAALVARTGLQFGLTVVALGRKRTG